MESQYVILDYTSGEDEPVIIGPFSSFADAQQFVRQDIADSDSPYATQDRYNILQLMSPEEAREY